MAPGLLLDRVTPGAPAGRASASGAGGARGEPQYEAADAEPAGLPNVAEDAPSRGLREEPGGDEEAETPLPLGDRRETD